MYVKVFKGLTVEEFYKLTKGSKGYSTMAADSTFINADKYYSMNRLSIEDEEKIIKTLIDDPRVHKFGYYATTTYVPGYYNRYILVKYKKGAKQNV